ncbi:hypothetical protein FWH58_02490 [Candidatus Saccharibacteria bacterium]|nr:hypothetical protein [Candidatus Saccharibacteria bacterium]
MRKFCLSIVTVALLVGGLLLMRTGDNATAAAPRVQVDVTPIETSLSLAPEETYDGKFSVTNMGSDTFDFHITANGFFVTDLTYETTFDDELIYNQIADWIKFDETNFYDLKPQEKQDVTYHITVPKDAPAGDQYAVLFAVVSREAANASMSIKTDARVGMKIYAEIAGETRTGGTVKSIDQRRWYSTPPIDSIAQIENTGNVNFYSQYEYVVRSLSGRELFKDSATSRIMPGTTREVKMTWDDAPTFGIFKIQHRISFFGQVQYNQETIVILMPIWAIVVLGMLLLGLILVIIRIWRRRLRRKKQSKQLRLAQRRK